MHVHVHVHVHVYVHVLLLALVAVQCLCAQAPPAHLIFKQLAATPAHVHARSVVLAA